MLQGKKGKKRKEGKENFQGKIVVKLKLKCIYGYILCYGSEKKLFITKKMVKI